jgi:hypothetical protein
MSSDRPVGDELFYVDGQTGMTKLKVAFRNSSKAPKISKQSALVETENFDSPSWL